MIDAEVEDLVPAAEVGADIGDAYAAQVGWDPRGESDPFVCAVFRPVRVQAWREVDEIAGRRLMRDGHWLV